MIDPCSGGSNSNKQLRPEFQSLELQHSEIDPAYEQMLLAQGGRLSEPSAPQQRKFPWIIDIFLYPFSKSGMIVQLLSTGIPFILRCISKFFYIFMLVFPPALVIFLLAMALHSKKAATVIRWMERIDASHLSISTFFETKPVPFSRAQYFNYKKRLQQSGDNVQYYAHNRIGPLRK